MRAALLGITLGITALLLALPGTALATEYTTFVGCDDLSEAPIPSHECEVGDFPAAYFESDEDVEYDVCVEFPSSAFLCAEEQFAEAETLYYNSITTNQVGRHYVYWYLSGTEVEIGSWVFDMKEPPPPPPPPAVVPPAALPTTPSVTSRPTAKCVAARHRVKRLAGQLRRAKSRKRKAKIRPKLRRARKAVRRSC